MPIPQFFLPNSGDHTNHFDNDSDLYASTAASVGVLRYTTDPDHPSVMRVSSAQIGQGVYKEVTVAGSVKHLVELAYKCVGSQGIRINVYNQSTGNTTIYRTTVAATVWSNFYKEVTTPANCIKLRLKLLRAKNSIQPFYIDDVKIHGNALYADPDDYSRSFSDTRTDHQIISGKVVRDRTGKHVSFRLSFPKASVAISRRLIHFAKAVESTHFYDGDVPVVTESATIRTAVTCNYIGVSSPSATHKAYFMATTAQPVTVAFAESSEFAASQYTNIGTDNSDYATSAITNTGKYGYHKFRFRITDYSDKADVQKFTVTYKGLADDLSTNNVDGVNFYAWDGFNWVMLDRSRTPDKQTLTFTTSKQEIAAQFVDVTNGYVRVLAQTRAVKAISGTLILKSYYIDSIINEDLNRAAALLNNAVLSASGAVISVRNLTTKLSLVRGQATHGYTIGDDRKSVVVTADQTDGDIIEVKYNQYFNVIHENLNEPTIRGGNITNPERVIELTLRTVTPIEKV